MADKVLDNPANADLVRFRSRRSGRIPSPASGPPESHKDPYWKAGVHPDLVEWLWDGIGPSLPIDCRWIFGAMPVLARRDTGIVFAHPVGSLTYALRLPERFREEALRSGGYLTWRFSDGSNLDVADISKEWVIVAPTWPTDYQKHFLKIAYDYAE
jgi:hypothetical protein